jgi:DNA-binding NtrC family response regulator
MNELKTEAIQRATTPETAIPKLVVTRGPSVGRSLSLAKAFSTVGRHATNHLVVDDPKVSGVHLEVRREGARVSVRDTQSTNGMWLGAHRVSEVVLALGGEVTIGDSAVALLADTAFQRQTGPRLSFGSLVGESSAMQEVFELLGRVAGKDITLLLQGETGTGKEEIARAVHATSPRADQPFVVIDATSLPETIAESLLFGHERGAFTGATERRAGFFEAAHGGTIFIDEIGELPMALQAKFLRVLERREVVRTGAAHPVPVDVRVIAATHRDLRHAIEAGTFREDLYFRLSQVSVFLPPLRDRIADIAPLAQRFLATQFPNASFEPEALTFLQGLPFPGNVRELRNFVLRAAALSADGVLRRADMVGEEPNFRRNTVAPGALTGKFAEAKERAIEQFERAYLAAIMKRTRGNLSLASREADVARHHFRDLLKKRGLYGLSFDEEGT